LFQRALHKFFVELWYVFRVGGAARIDYDLDPMLANQGKPHLDFVVGVAEGEEAAHALSTENSTSGTQAGRGPCFPPRPRRYCGKGEARGWVVITDHPKETRIRYIRESPLTSSVGRLFDAVAAVVLGRQVVD